MMKYRIGRTADRNLDITTRIYAQSDKRIPLIIDGVKNPTSGNANNLRKMLLGAWTLLMEENADCR